MVAFCKDCRHMVVRNPVELREHAASALADGGIVAMDAVPGYLCDHPEARKLAAAVPYGAVGCAPMRLNGAACGPEGVLFKGKEAAA